MTVAQLERMPWVRLPERLRQALQDDRRRIVVVGARGWIGRTLLELAEEALGTSFADRVLCFGTSQQKIKLCSGSEVIQEPLKELERLDSQPTILFHLAFLTMDKIGQMDEADYCSANREISGKVRAALDRIGVERLFLASSGAAAFADDPTAAAPLRLYGGLKRDDEQTFASWAEAGQIDCRAAICRIYSVSGPFINKHDTYALAQLTLKALSGEPLAVQSRRAVLRSYVAVEEVLATALAVLLAENGAAVTRFDTGGEPIELGALVQRISALTGASVAQREIAEEPANRYCGDHEAWLALLHSHGLKHFSLDAQIAATASWLAKLVIT